MKVRKVFGITRSTWSNYENGITNPGLKEIINISRFFGVSIAKPLSITEAKHFLVETIEFKSSQSVTEELV